MTSFTRGEIVRHFLSRVRIILKPLIYNDSNPSLHYIASKNSSVNHILNMRSRRLPLIHV